MVIEIWEHKFPMPVDREKFNDFVKSVGKRAFLKAGYSMVRVAWTHTGGGCNRAVFLGELESVQDIERVWNSPEWREFIAEFADRFPNAETARTQILEVI